MVDIFTTHLFHDIVAKLSLYGEYAEVFAESSKICGAVFEDGKLDRIDSVYDKGIGIRLISDGVTHYSYTNILNEKSIREAASVLIKSVKEKNTAELPVFSAVKEYLMYEKSFNSFEQAERAATAEKIYKACCIDKRIVQAAAVYKDSIRKTRVVNSLGVDVVQELPYIIALANVTASDGRDIQTGYEPMGFTGGLEYLSEIDIEKIAVTASERALKNLEADYIKGGTMPVVISSQAGGTLVHEAVGHGLEADLACEGASVYSDRIGDKVASSLINVIDNPTIKGNRGSFAVDDEGAAARPNRLIENGILKKYMFDRLYAMKEGVETTGNGRRQSYRHKPIVRMSNTYIEPGDSLSEDIIKSVDKGLFVRQMGGGQVNTVNGDFVFEVTEGYIIEKGSIKDAVRNATLIGNGPEVLSKVDMVANDFGFAIGTCGKEGQGVPVTDAQPTLRIPEITVGGR